MKTLPAQHISISVQRPPAAVYDFVSDPQNLPRWASGLSRSKMKRVGDDWVADSPMGEVKVAFAARNELGVLDHDVTLPSGDVMHNPLRVLRNGGGSEVVFTLYRQPDVEDAAYDKDAETIQHDLQTLKSLLET